MKFDDLNFAMRAVRKHAQRLLDEKALASGEKTREQLAIENGAFAFPRDRIRIDFSRVRTKY